MPTTRLDGDDMYTLWRQGMGGLPDNAENQVLGMQCLNQGQNLLAAQWGDELTVLEASETLTSVAAQDTYSLTTEGVIKVRSISSDNGGVKRLKREDQDCRNRYGALPSASAWAWYPAGGSNDTVWTVGLIGRPSTSGVEYTVWLTIIPPEIRRDANVNTSVLPQAWDLAIVQAALMWGKSLTGQVKQAREQLGFVQLAMGAAAGQLPGTLEKVWAISGYTERGR